MEIIMTIRNSRLSIVAAALMWAGAAPALTAQEPQVTTTAGAPLPDQQTTAPGPALGDVHAAGPDDRYRLRSGDVLELNFPFVPDFDQTIAVQPDGFITLRALGAFRVSGTTVPELTERLRSEYSSILLDPFITIELKEFEKPYFIVAGEVEKPGKYDLRGETTLTQAVAVAGGLKERAKHSKAVLFQRLPAGDFKATKLDLKKMLKDADLNTDLRLQPGDLVYIPRGPASVKFSDVASSISSLWVLSLLK
jgi:polysaccharide biosynthesis/export protein